MRKLLLAAPIATLAGVYACAASSSGHLFDDVPGEAGGAGGGGAASTGTFNDDAGLNGDAVADSPFNPDGACAAVVEEAKTERLPVDIIWMVDNSSSMAPAVTEVREGLNAFAALIAGSQLDYRVIMLSRRGTTPTSSGGSDRYPVCIPPPLAGDDNCGNGARFFHSSVDIKSTQPLEQLLGTLGQTAGYTPGDERGGEPWAGHLRPEATKTIVVVTDDNARLSADDFEHYAGGRNPASTSNTLMLPPGILEPSWNGLFDGYVFSGIYGWGSDSSSGTPCQYPDGTEPSSAGPTYTTLVNRTGGVRAKICDGHAAWGPFFDAVAQAVIATSRLSCELAIPVPSDGQDIDYGKINVQITAEGGDEVLYRVDGASACGAEGGWYYDDPAHPTRVILCPASCDRAQASVGPGRDGRIEVLFGCETIAR